MPGAALRLPLATLLHPFGMPRVDRRAIVEIASTFMRAIRGIGYDINETSCQVFNAALVDVVMQLRAIRIFSLTSQKKTRHFLDSTSFFSSVAWV